MIRFFKNLAHDPLNTLADCDGASGTLYFPRMVFHASL